MPGCFLLGQLGEQSRVGITVELAATPAGLTGVGGLAPQPPIPGQQRSSPSIQRKRDEGQGQIARSLARAGALRSGLAERDAADVIHALMSPDVYRLLVTERGWALERYERWLAGTLIAQLLPQAGRGT